MNYQKASQVSLLVELIKSSEIVSKEYSEAHIPEDLISNIKILCMKDSSFRRSFYSIMQKFRQHNKIFVQACNWGQNAVKYSLTKNR